MSILVKHVTDYPGMHYRIFLIVDNGLGFLVNYDKRIASGVGSLCDCCLLPRNKQDLCRAARAAIESGTVSGKIHWIGTDPDGDREPESSVSWSEDVDVYVKCLEDISPEARRALRKVAEDAQ